MSRYGFPSSVHFIGPVCSRTPRPSSARVPQCCRTRSWSRLRPTAPQDVSPRLPVALGARRPGVLRSDMRGMGDGGCAGRGDRQARTYGRSGPSAPLPLPQNDGGRRRRTLVPLGRDAFSSAVPDSVRAAAGGVKCRVTHTWLSTIWVCTRSCCETEASTLYMCCPSGLLVSHCRLRLGPVFQAAWGRRSEPAAYVVSARAVRSLSPPSNCSLQRDVLAPNNPWHSPGLCSGLHVLHKECSRPFVRDDSRKTRAPTPYPASMKISAYAEQSVALSGGPQRCAFSP